MTFKNGTPEDFDIAYTFTQQLWDYNIYEKEHTEIVYRKILADENSFLFFLMDGDEYLGFCHGDFFQTLWMSGLTCYVSSLFVSPAHRSKGCGRLLLDHAKELASSKGCRAITLDSGMPRTAAHRFYEKYGFEKSCYGFELVLPCEPSHS